MNKKSLFLSLSSVLFTQAALAELTMLNDGVMSNISGQSGITLDTELHLEADEIAYFDDGAGIAIQGVKISGAPSNHQESTSDSAKMQYIVDIEAGGSLNIAYNISPTRFEFSDIRLGTEAGSMTGPSGGGFFWDSQVVGNLKLKSGGALSAAGYTFESSSTMTNGAFGYVTQGHRFWLDDIESTSQSVMTLDLASDVKGEYLDINLDHYTGEYTVGAIRHSSNPTESGGMLWGKYDQSINVQLRGGGRVGVEGITLDIKNTIHDYDFAWGDEVRGGVDGNWLGLIDMSGHYNIDNLTLDVAQDDNGELGLAIAFDKLDVALHVDKVLLSETAARFTDYLAGNTLTDGPEYLKSIGSLDINLVFANQNVDGVDYTNIFYVQAGGHADAGEQGLRINTQWSLVDDYNDGGTLNENVSNITYTEDGNAIMLSGLQSWGKGDLTLNVTKEETVGSTEFFDGIRIGFENFTGGYKMDGLRVGKNDANLKNREIQGGSELLLALGVFPSYDFTVDGHMTIGTGGASGSGLTINSDMHITNGRAALMMDENGSGIWASGLDYDIHKRNMTIDVTDDGLAIVEAESWSIMDISDLRLGDKVAGKSFGRFIVQRYETGSSMTLKAGGSGDICVGGNATSSSGCAAAGGIWEERGVEGITVSLKNILAEAVDKTKRNSFAWESTGGSSSQTPMRIVFDNITTNDGDGINNTYGIQNDIAIDIYNTKVVMKASGVDSGGVSYSKGDEKLVDGNGYRYVGQGVMTELDKKDRPLGFAVNANTSFKELSIGSVQMIHNPNPVITGSQTGTASTLLYGMKLQNVNLTSNLTATPIQ